MERESDKRDAYEKLMVKIEFVSQAFLFNGVLVKFKGVIKRTSLVGEGSIELLATPLSCTPTVEEARRSELESRILHYGE